jgi:hypothetical protein
MAVTSYEVQFEMFMVEIDSVLKSEIGLCHRDLPDFPYAAAFEDGMDATEVAAQIIASLDELG